jgi:uncharacterized protein (DUF1330 family)
MRYLVTSGLSSADLPRGCRVIADGEARSLEEPWSFGAPLIAQIEAGADLSVLKAKPGISAFTVEGALPPGEGRAFAIGAHKMRDAEAFRPYAAQVPDVIAPYGCRYIARGGKVTPLAGSFTPDRLVLMEFPNAAQVAAFYFSDAYAPLLKIRLAATEPRFVLLARKGALPQPVRRLVATRLGAQ